MKKNNRAFTILELMVVVVILAMLAGMAIPSYVKYMRNAQSAEVRMNLRRLYDGAVTYFSHTWSSSGGDILEHQFPTTVAMNPSSVPSGIKVVTNNWNDNGTWSALNFGLSDPHRFTYQYDSSGIGNAAQFTASSFGDLDGDGDCSTYIRFASVFQMEVRGASGMHENNANE